MRLPGGTSPVRRLALLTLLAALVACTGRMRIRLPEGTPIVLISIDTLRSDRLPAYGYRQVATPAIDALVSDSILYERAFSPAPLTLPAHASIFTGLLPTEHGVRENQGYRLDAADSPLLTRTLKKRGYRTGAAVSSFVLSRGSGMAADFEFYEDELEFVSWTRLGSLQRPGDDTLRRTLEWLRSVHQQPFFLFFHIYEPHTPYQPPEPFASRYADPYDGEVAASDAIVGQLVAELQRLGVYDSSLIFLLSDHGEGLGDHGSHEHGPLLYREDLQVPLLLKLPGAERGGERVAQPAQLIDVYPTILELLGLTPPPDLPGISLLQLDGPSAPSRSIYSETFFPLLHFGWSDLASIIDYPYHLIDGPDPELYDLAEDPEERRNLIDAKEHVFRALKQNLQPYKRPLEPPGQVDPETRRKLAALGYVGAGARLPAEGPLPDPKARIDSLDDARRAYRHFANQDYEQAVEAFRSLLSREPQMVDAWEQLGHSQMRLGLLEEALFSFQQGFVHSHEAPHLAASLAGAYLALNRLEEARTYAELATSAYDAANDLLAQIALKGGDLQTAERHADRAVATRGTWVGPLVTQAELRLAQGSPQQALELTRQALQELGARTDPEIIKGLYFVRGRAYADLGQGRQAEAAFLNEIQRFPEQLPPYTHLTLLYALLGKADRAGATLQRMVEANPTPRAYAEAVRTLEILGDPSSATALLRYARQRWPDSPELQASP